MFSRLPAAAVGTILQRNRVRVAGGSPLRSAPRAAAMEDTAVVVFLRRFASAAGAGCVLSSVLGVALTPVLPWHTVMKMQVPFLAAIASTVACINAQKGLKAFGSWDGEFTSLQPHYRAVIWFMATMQTWPTVSVWLLLAMLGRRPYFSAVPLPGGGAREGDLEQSLFIGGMPMSWHIHAMLAASPTGLSVVNLCEEFEGHLHEYQHRGIDQLRLPIVDYCSVDECSIREGVAFIANAVHERRSVYVHCKSGIGRCAMVLVSYLARHHAMSVQEANAWVRRHRPQVIGNVAERPGVQAYFRAAGAAGWEGASAPAGNALH